MNSLSETFAPKGGGTSHGARRLEAGDWAGQTDV
jgi:hypothetical protein